MTKARVLTCGRGRGVAAAPAAAEPVVARDNFAFVPVPVADIQAAVRRVAEDVIPEEHIESVALGILLPAFRPELGVIDELVEHLRTHVVALLLELLAEFMADHAAVFLLLREVEGEWLAVEIEDIALLLELDDTLAAVSFQYRSVEREPSWKSEIDHVIDGLDLVRAAKHAKEQSEDAPLLETLDLLEGVVVATECQLEVVGESDIESDFTHRRSPSASGLLCSHSQKIPNIQVSFGCDYFSQVNLKEHITFILYT